MKPWSFMMIAGEPSGDLLAAELAPILRQELTASEAIPTWDYQPLHASLEPRFYGAGGPRMASAGVEIASDLTALSTIGLSDPANQVLKLRRIFKKLYCMALERRPDAIICVDYSGFNRRFAQAIKKYVRPRLDWFHDWDPKIIQYVSPQVWASRPGRAYQLARDFDLLLSIIPFEKEWYHKHGLRLPVEFVGHPLIDRYAHIKTHSTLLGTPCPILLLLPGSRSAELSRHLPVMLGALEILRREIPGLQSRLVLPSEALVQQAERGVLPQGLRIQAGGLAEALAEANAAIASTGTVTLECARFGLPTVAIYRTSWVTYQIARRLVSVKYLAMPNLLAGEELFPEFIQDQATTQNIARAVLELLRARSRETTLKSKLALVVKMLGPGGASRRAAHAILRLLRPQIALSNRAEATLEGASFQ